MRAFHKRKIELDVTIREITYNKGVVMSLGTNGAGEDN
jgi:hypothetical protein